MKVVLKVREKGVVILPKKLREKVGVQEGDAIVAEAAGETIVLRVLKPLEVEVDSELVDRIMEEEKSLERERMRGLLSH